MSYHRFDYDQESHQTLGLLGIHELSRLHHEVTLVEGFTTLVETTHIQLFDFGELCLRFRG